MPPGKVIALIIYALVFVILVSSLLMCICPYSKLKYRVRISGEESGSLWRVCHSLLGLQCCLSLSWAAGAYARNQAWLSSDSMPERTSAIVGILDRLFVFLNCFIRIALSEPSLTVQNPALDSCNF